MRKIWNALRYGDKETKKCVGGVLFFSFAAVILVVISILTGKIGVFIAGFLAGVVALVLSQTFHLVDDGSIPDIKETEKRKRTDAAIGSAEKMEGGKEPFQKERQNQYYENDEKNSQLRKKQEGTAEEEITRFENYNRQFLKKTFRKNRVRRDHRAIIVDSSKSYHIKECPAFIWRAHNKVYLLLLEKEPRRISISRDLIKHMDYMPNVPGIRGKEYLSFQHNNLITSVFEEYLPDYFDGKAKNKNLKYKHLYQIYPDILISNRSAASVMDLLYLNFMPEDKITRSEQLNGFFKRVYAAHIMFQDKVYSITEYKEKIEAVLKEMCYAVIPEREFEQTLDNMVKGRMISVEYADYYRSLRKKTRENH